MLNCETESDSPRNIHVKGVITYQSDGSPAEKVTVQMWRWENDWDDRDDDFSKILPTGYMYTIATDYTNEEGEYKIVYNLKDDECCWGNGFCNIRAYKAGYIHENWPAVGVHCTGWEGETNIDVYPAFVDTSNNDFRLTESSPCVGVGTDSVYVSNTRYHCPETDYFGNPRPNPIDEFVDMGAIESPFEREWLNISTKDLVIPVKFDLKQNYPNPFNPRTMISYQLPMTNEVELSIYNLLGQKVITLVSERQKAGHHQVEWNASGFASGVYYYQLVAGEFREVKKMILLR